MSILSLYMRVLGLLGREKYLALVLALANLALATAQFAEPVLFGRIIDRLSGAQGGGQPLTYGDLAPLLAAWAGFALFSIPAGVLVALYADRLAHRRRLAVTALYFEHVLHLPLSFHSQVHSGRLLKIMLEGAGGMSGLWLSFFRENCASLAALVILLPLSLALNWRLAVLLIALVAVFGVLTNFVLRRTEALQQTVERYNSSLAEQASDALGNVPVIQSFTRIDLEANALRRIIDLVLAAQMPVLTWWAIAGVGARASATLTLLAIFLLGTWLNLHGLATVGEIVMFMNFATMLIARLEQVVGFFNSLFMQAPKLKDFFDVLDAEPQVADSPFAVDPGRLQGRVAFDHVTFSYDGRRHAVSDVSFEAAPGETVALVGATGSGKSTTLGLLHRVFDPIHGRVLIDGFDIRDLTLASLRRNIGVVFQEPMLFARSIEENLRVGRPDASADDIRAALELAQAEAFVARQSDGLATIVGERGRALSGGERQRIAIARALLKNPPILIFDEATSALDAATERELQAALETATRGRTTFVIAHRLATIRAADRIIVFDHGEIVENGTFNDLIAKNGRFADLARAQFMVGPSASAKEAT
ncbi:glucan ABC transporter ATP-binding protein/ permease [Methylocapsa acidiphila]|uniref:glucan ABC transporter ATP-binding protein/ permease n=1 Tax=Methylocapsa acidiphila TaxID=133552 RepID=UPI0005668D9B|nr:glucan ABC transporter ATP-binding protein/ permease [Methylocapsa acidiphila]